MTIDVWHIPITDDHHQSFWVDIGELVYEITLKKNRYTGNMTIEVRRDGALLGHTIQLCPLVPVCIDDVYFCMSQGELYAAIKEN